MRNFTTMFNRPWKQLFRLSAGASPLPVVDAWNLFGYVTACPAHCRSPSSTAGCVELHPALNQQAYVNMPRIPLLLRRSDDPATGGLFLGGPCLGSISRCLQVGPAEVRSIQVGLAEVRSLQVGPPEVRSLQVGLSEARSLQVGRGEVRALQMGREEVRSFQVGAAEVRSLQVGREEVRPLQVGPTEGRCLQVGLAEVRPLQVDAAEARSLQVGRGEVRSAKVRLAEIKALKLSILVPLRATAQNRKHCLNIDGRLRFVRRFLRSELRLAPLSVFPNIGRQNLHNRPVICLGRVSRDSL